MTNSRKVYIINRGARHDFSRAEGFGELVFLSEGIINRLDTGLMLRLFMPQLLKSHKDDYIVLTSLSVMCSIACAIMGALHGKLNILIYNKGRYLERCIVLERSDSEQA